MEAFTSQVKKIASTADDAERKKLLDSLRDLQYSIESPDDTLQRVTYYNLRLVAIRIGIDLKLFEILAENGAPMKVEELAKKTGAADVLLGRLLRYLAAFSMAEEVGIDTFTANNVTRALAIEGFQAGVIHYFGNIGPAFQATPDFLAETNYNNITEPTKTPFQKGHNTDLPAFKFAATQPERLAVFGKYLAANRAGMPTWLDVYPLGEECKALPPDDVLLIDIGGGFGHQCVALKTRYPDIPGRVILQDIPETLAQAIPHGGVEVMAHDFFQPQPIKGAKYYYMRNVLHDYPDDKCRDILKNTIDAMGEHSVILIDDMVLPNSGVHWQAAQLDLTMMCALGAMERTQEQWYELLESAGLKVVKIYTYTSLINDSIIVAVPK